MSATTVPFFTPTQISGCALWLDAADPTSLVVSGSVVTQWKDKSAVNNTTTLLGSPTYSTTPYRYVGTRNMTQNITVPSTAYTVTASQPGCLFLMYADTQTQGTDFAALFGSSDPFNYFNQSLIRPDAYAYSLSSTTPNASVVAVLNTKNLVLYCLQYTHGSANLLLRLNGTSLVTTNISALVPSGSLVISGTGWGGKGNINLCEALSFKSLLSFSQLQQVEGYLAWKWGLQATLPTGHPYKSSPIPPLGNPPTQLPSFVQTTAPSFLPTQISGCSLWLDATDSSTLSLSGSAVTQWRDKSVSNAIFAASATRPTLSNAAYNGYTAINFGGSAYFQNTTFPFTTSSRTTFFVYDEIVEQNNVGVLAFASSGTDYNQLNTMAYETGNKPSQYLQLVQGFGQNGLAMGIQSTPISFALYSDTFSSGTETAYVNGSQTATATTAAAFTNSTGLVIGARMTSGTVSGSLNGTIGEILLFTRPLSTAQRQQVEGYLAWKWGVQANLPLTHPYKTGPPYSAAIAAPSRSLALSAGWQPTQISGCQIWLDAADPSGTGLLPPNNSGISTWKDKSGNNNNATAGNAPLLSYNYQNKLPALLFNGTSTFLNLPNFTSVPISIFMVAKHIVNAGNTFYIALGPSSIMVREVPGSPSFFGVDGSNPVYGAYTTAIKDTNYHIWSFCLPASANGILNIDGTLRASSGFIAPANTLLTANTLGAWNQQANGNLNGAMNEILIFNTFLSTPQRQQVEGYLAWKWGLVGTLPLTHPYKKLPPPP